MRRALGRNQLFIDVDKVPPGANFVKLLRDELARCDVLLVIIGRNWLNARGDDGRRRLDNPDDIVRSEIATALRRNIPVIPVLVDGAAAPKGQELPEELKDLSVSNALDLRHTYFQTDINRLIRSLKAPHRIENIKRICVGCGAGLLMAVLPGLLAVLLAVSGGYSFTWGNPLIPLSQRAFEFGAFIFSGAAAAVARHSIGRFLESLICQCQSPFEFGITNGLSGFDPQRYQPVQFWCRANTAPRRTIMSFVANWQPPLACGLASEPSQT